MLGGMAPWSLNEVSISVVPVSIIYSQVEVLCDAVSVQVKERELTPGGTVKN